MSLPFEVLQKKLQKLKNNTKEVLVEVLNSNEKSIIKLNTQDQLFKKGIDSRGKVIEPAYAPSTIKRKKRKGQPSNRVTLKDTGDFYSDMDIDYGQKDFTMINYDDKYKDLRKKYGEDILGLTDESIEKLRDILRVKLFQKIKRLI